AVHRPHRLVLPRAAAGPCASRRRPAPGCTPLAGLAVAAARHAAVRARAGARGAGAGAAASAGALVAQAARTPPRAVRRRGLEPPPGWAAGGLTRPGSGRRRMAFPPPMGSAGMATLTHDL